MGRPTDEQLAAIRERCDKATEGPWKEYGCYVAQDGLIVAEAHLSEAEDVEFIAHAREDIPMLLAEIEHLKWDLSHEYYEGFKHGHSEAEGGEGAKEIDAYRDALKHIIDMDYGKACVFYDEDLGMWYDRDSSLYLTYDEICTLAVGTIKDKEDD
ncbi:hypothetical protein [Shouchella clausii]|uniref:hypothetical protein n=1 Tax=Shouchella clausii TaxID=79880 RepID=UPI000BA7A303|nr:hypothetical protein [Shouchella clausii]PAD91668.1 hypothetical protein CHH52_13685 [Shouchella clausii]